MENAQLVGLSRQGTLSRQLDLIANNLANIDTGGYKAQKLVFKEQMMPGAEDNSFLRPDRAISFVIDDQNIVDYKPGATQETGNPLDVAMSGSGWFTVQTPQGERYTRNGSFAINSTGQLVNQNNYPVLTNGGPITFGPNESTVSIASDGTISTNQGSRGKLQIVDFDPKQPPTKVGETLFAGKNPTPATLPQVVQGRLEKSNVNGIVEMTSMIGVQRAYQAITTMLKETDDLRKNSIATLGQVNA
jgi:flagellar basal-body rod protein FlgF